MSIYKSDRDDQIKEIEFELEYQLKLSTADRFNMMFKKSKEIAELMRKNGHREPFKITKRT